MAQQIVDVKVAKIMTSYQKNPMRIYSSCLSNQIDSKKSSWRAFLPTFIPIRS